MRKRTPAERRPIVKGNSELLVDRKGRICTLSINRPEKRNALTPDCLHGMAEALGELSQEGAVRSVVIRGSGNEAFSSGYDVAALPTKGSLKRMVTLKEGPPIEDAIQAIRDFPYPVVAMINGYAYGGGCELAIACDIRIAARHARMGMPPAKLGMVYRYSGYRLFLTVLGFTRTLEIFLTGRSYDSQQCLEMGLVNHVVDSDRLEAVTYELAREMAENAPLVLRGTKSILNAIAQYPILPQEQVEEFDSIRDEAFRSRDFEEGKQAFRAKRKPQFEGR
jgi:enoyl-CoA hydratase/carnithine racemase